MPAATARKTTAAPASARADQRAQQRGRLITLVQIGRRDLRLSDEVYRTILQAEGGADSSTQMGVRQLQAVLDKFKALGFKVTASKAPRQGKGRRILSQAPEDRKARAMWLTLHAIGQVRDPSEAALLAYVKRQTGVERLEWVRDALPVVESLKAWLLRTLPDQVKPYLQVDVATWAGHMPPIWRTNWDQAVRALRNKVELGHVQVLDQWLDLWELIGKAKEGGTCGR